MLAKLFRRHRPQLPTSSAELAEALRAAAQFADSDSAKLEYNAAADALDRAITHTRQHGDEPTRDALAYALGRAELNIKDQLIELIEVSKDTHLLVQGVQTTQSSQEAAAGALWAAFQSFSESLTQWREEIEAWRGMVDGTLESFSQSRAQSIEERKLLREDMDESKTHRARMQHTLDTALPAITQAITALDTRHGSQIKALTAQLEEIQRLLEIAGQHEHDGGGVDG